jgi:hypothetical protein
MLVHLGMLLTFVAAALADQLATLQERTQRLRVGLVEAREDACGSPANIGTIQIEADAMDKVVNMLFRQTGVSAGSADRRALVERLHSLGKTVTRQPRRLGMARHHLRQWAGDPITLVHESSLHGTGTTKRLVTVPG